MSDRPRTTCGSKFIGRNRESRAYRFIFGSDDTLEQGFRQQRQGWGNCGRHVVEESAAFNFVPSSLLV